MFTKILNWVMGFGLTEIGAKIVLGILAAVLFSAAFVTMKLHYDHKIVAKAVAQANVQALQKAAPANDTAAEARATDTIVIHEKMQERTDAIAKATDQPPTDADLALNCLRLRQAGYDTATISACAGH